MAEYIEREALDDFKDDLMGRFIVLCFGNDYNKLQLLTIGNVIDELYEKHSTKPAADVVEVRHGEWVQDVYDKAMDRMTCSCCKEYWNICDNDTETFNYCPNCGAKMDADHILDATKMVDGKGEGE